MATKVERQDFSPKTEKGKELLEILKKEKDSSDMKTIIQQNYADLIEKTLSVGLFSIVLVNVGLLTFDDKDRIMIPTVPETDQKQKIYDIVKIHDDWDRLIYAWERACNAHIIILLLEYFRSKTAKPTSHVVLFESTQSHNNSNHHNNNQVPDRPLQLHASTVRTSKTLCQDDILVDETDRLIIEGERMTILNQALTDVVLVIGNTGAGKTTVTKFLTEVDSLEAYDAGDGILIRDTDEKISVDATIVSKTIFPELMINNDTKTAFYDLPGFSDTRNSSTEIANAIFMKKVADHAQRVKLLFVVNYNSLRNGHTRTDFKSFLEQATTLIRNPAKFKLAMALVATKVEVNRSPDKIIDGIGTYLEAVKGSLHEVISDVEQLKAAQDLIGGIVSKDSAGRYNRISYFKQPDEEGPVNERHITMKQREHIQNVLDNNINYIGKSSENFGHSLSPEARLVIMKLLDNIIQKITKIMESIGATFRHNLTTKLSSIPGEALEGQLKETQILLNMVISLTTVESLQKFRTSLQAVCCQAQMQNETSEDIFELLRLENRLDFVGQISGLNLTSPINEWCKPIQDSVNWFGNEVQRKADDFEKQKLKLQLDKKELEKQQLEKQQLEKLELQKQELEKQQLEKLELQKQELERQQFEELQIQNQKLEQLQLEKQELERQQNKPTKKKSRWVRFRDGVTGRQ